MVDACKLARGLPRTSAGGGLAGSVTARQRVRAYQHFVQHLSRAGGFPQAGGTGAMRINVGVGDRMHKV